MLSDVLTTPRSSSRLRVIVVVVVANSMTQACYNGAWIRFLL